MQNLPKILTVSAAAAALCGAASAQMDYHGFDKKTVDTLNERMETPLTGEQLEILAEHRDIEVCGGVSVVDKLMPEGWEDRLAGAAEVGGDTVMPVPTSGLSPEYPPLYNVLGVEGACDAMFDVTPAGDTADIAVSCSLPLFTQSITAMLEDLDFEPAPEQASPETDDIFLPVNFCLSDEDAGTGDG